MNAKLKARTLMVTTLILLIILSGCEISRDGPGDITTDAGNTAPTEPAATDEPAPEPEPTDEATTEPAPATDEPVAGGNGVDGTDIDPEVQPLSTAPEEAQVEANTVLVKLSQVASIQAMESIDLTEGQGVVSAGAPTLDQILTEIGASGLEPVIEEVAESIPDESEESISAQAVETAQLFKVSYQADKTQEEVIEMLSQDSSVEFVEPNYIAGIVADPVYLPLNFEPNDPYLKFQWNFRQIQIPEAWDMSTGENVKIAVIDTGVDFRAPDLANTKRAPGYDFVDKDDDPTDDQGHGTHVAGTIAQSTDNSIGVAGIAYNAEIIPIKVLGADGQGSYEGIIQGIIYAVDQGAQVINMSLAGRSGSQALRDAVEYAHSRGVVVVAAAGNSNSRVEYPAAYDEFVIAVGSVRPDNQRAPYSNFGSQIDIVAPGGDTGVDLTNDGFADGILQQTFKQAGGSFTYLFFQGTSMASPHVAGVAALIKSINPNASPDQIKAAMMQTAINLGSPEEFGAGLIQAADAVKAMGGASPVTPTEEPPTPTDEPPTPTATQETAVIVTPTDTPTSTPEPPPPTEEPEPPTATPTETSTPAPPPVTPTDDLLVNGNFESGDGWVFGDTPIRGSYESDIVLTGSQAARLGATSGADRFSFSSVWQKVTIPAEANQVTLNANIYPISQDQQGGDIQYVMILNSNFRVARTLSAELSNSQSWETRSYDLSDFSGQTIYIYFSVFNRGGSNSLSAMYVDDVSLQWAP